MRWGNRNLIRQCCTKGTQDVSSVSQTWQLSSLGTDNHCILGRNYEFPGSWTSFPKGQALGHTWPCQACLDFRQETKFLLHTSAHLHESLKQSWPPTKLALTYKCNCPSVSFWSQSLTYRCLIQKVILCANRRVHNFLTQESQSIVYVLRSIIHLKLSCGQGEIQKSSFIILYVGI